MRGILRKNLFKREKKGINQKPLEEDIFYMASLQELPAVDFIKKFRLPRLPKKSEARKSKEDKFEDLLINLQGFPAIGNKRFKI